MSTNSAPTTFTSGMASETTHWYDEAGNPAYEVPNKSSAKKCPACTGSMRGAAAKAVTLACPTCDENGYIYPENRSANLSDAKKLSLCHSVTGVTKVLANYNIQNYLLKQLAEAAYTEPAGTGIPFDEWHAKVTGSAAEHAKHARDRGTDIHATVERGIRGESLVGYTYAAWYTAFENELRRVLGFFPKFEAEKSFTHRGLGYGCKVDAVWFGGASGDTDFGPILIDAKTKDIDKLEAMPRAWDSEVMQLAGNREAALIPGARCFNAFLDRKEPVCFLVEASERELARGWTMFKHCLAIKQIQDNYVPAWATEPLVQP